MEPVLERYPATPLVKLDNLRAVAAAAHAHVHQHAAVKEAFYMAWACISDRSERPVTEAEFTREYLWCVYVSGLSAKVLTARYDAVATAYGIIDSQRNFIPSALNNLPEWDAVKPVWANHAKYDAVLTVRRLIARSGWDTFHRSYLADKEPKTIQGLPFMGPALSYHLARNIGNIHAVKPDVHLVRIAKQFQCASPLAMCSKLSDLPGPLCGWPTGQIDLLLWYCAATTAR